MAKFIKFDGQLINKNKIYSLAPMIVFETIQIVCFMKDNGEMSEYSENFSTEQERDTRWQELENLLLTDKFPFISSGYDKAAFMHPTYTTDEVLLSKPKETKTYYISIFDKEVDGKFLTSWAFRSKEESQNIAFSKIIKTIEVEL